MDAKYVWEFGALIFLVLGTIHLYYTFFTNKFSSKNNKVIEDMKSSFPILTRETTMWKAWVGFNASHSSGAMFIGIMNIYLAHNYFNDLKNDTFFLVLNILTVGFYLWLARRYWFTIPFYGILMTLLSFILVFVMVNVLS